MKSFILRRIKFVRNIYSHAGHGYVGNVNEFRTRQNSTNYGIYDKDWNADAFLDEDDLDDEEDGWDVWDSEE